MKLSIENRLAALEAAVANSFKGEKGDPSNVPGPEGKPGRDGESIIGPAGRNGRDAKIAIGKVAAGETASVSVRQENDIFILDFVLPRGERGESVVGPKGERGAPGETVVGPKGETGAPGETVVGPKGETGAPGRDGVTLEEVAKVIDDILAIVSVATEVRALLGTSGKDALTQLLDIKAQIAALALDPRYQRAGAFRDEWTSRVRQHYAKLDKYGSHTPDTLSPEFLKSRLGVE